MSLNPYPTTPLLFFPPSQYCLLVGVVVQTTIKLVCRSHINHALEIENSVGPLVIDLVEEFRDC